MEEEGQDGYMLQEQSMQGYGNSMAPGIQCKMNQFLKKIYDNDFILYLN